MHSIACPFGILTIEKPGFTDTYSFWSYPTASVLCHVHFECNWAGGTNNYHGYYCSSGAVNEGAMMPGWVADAKDMTFIGGTSSYQAEAFAPGEWKTIKMNIKKGECMYDSLTVVFMGVDPLSDRSYKWEIKDVTIKGEATTKYSLEKASRSSLFGR